jgi:ABC-2 type transport system ATP-binding protein
VTAPSPGREADPAATATRDWWGTEDVCVRYGDKLALDHVTFRAMPGRVSAVVGGDGAGRTTLLRCLAGALAVTSGQIRLPPPLRIGYLSAGSGTYPDLSVDENLAFRATAYQLPAAVARERSAELLERAGLSGARDRLAGRLSGGMRQKLGVIASMLHQPDLLVLDEPTTGVDPVSRADLWWLIAQAAANGAAVVFATSYLDEAERALNVLALDAGRELASGTPEEIIAAMPGTLWVSDARPDGEARRRAWRRGGRWRIWDPPGPPGQPGPVITDLRHQNSDEPDMIMTQLRDEPEPGWPVAPDLQDAVTVAILARELAGVEAENVELEGSGPR